MGSPSAGHAAKNTARGDSATAQTSGTCDDAGAPGPRRSASSRCTQPPYGMDTSRTHATYHRRGLGRRTPALASSAHSALSDGAQLRTAALPQHRANSVHARRCSCHVLRHDDCTPTTALTTPRWRSRTLRVKMRQNCPTVCSRQVSVLPHVPEPTLTRAQATQHARGNALLHYSDSDQLQQGTMGPLQQRVGDAVTTTSPSFPSHTRHLF